ncbi:O-antigen ligase family protein [Methylobacterium persicinum]
MDDARPARCRPAAGHADPAPAGTRHGPVRHPPGRRRRRGDVSRGHGLRGDFVGLLTPGNDSSFTGRTQIWDFAASEIARRPWTGYGFGSFWDVGDANDPLLRAPPGSWLATLKIGERADVVINEAHNGYLDLRLQGGAPALAFAVLAQILTILALAVKLFSRRTGRPDAVAAATYLVIALVVLVHNATESSFWMRGQVLANVSILISLLAFRREPEREPT